MILNAAEQIERLFMHTLGSLVRCRLETRVLSKGFSFASESSIDFHPCIHSANTAKVYLPKLLFASGVEMCARLALVFACQ